MAMSNAQCQVSPFTLIISEPLVHEFIITASFTHAQHINITTVSIYSNTTIVS